MSSITHKSREISEELVATREALRNYAVEMADLVNENGRLRAAFAQMNRQYHVRYLEGIKELSSEVDSLSSRLDAYETIFSKQAQYRQRVERILLDQHDLLVRLSSCLTAGQRSSSQNIHITDEATNVDQNMIDEELHNLSKSIENVKKCSPEPKNSAGSMIASKSKKSKLILNDLMSELIDYYVMTLSLD